MNQWNRQGHLLCCPATTLMLQNRLSLTISPCACRNSQPADLQYLASHLASSFIPNSVIIDATAAEEPPTHYLEVGHGNMSSYMLCSPISHRSRVNLFRGREFATCIRVMGSNNCYEGQCMLLHLANDDDTSFHSYRIL